MKIILKRVIFNIGFWVLVRVLYNAVNNVLIVFIHEDDFEASYI